MRAPSARASSLAVALLCACARAPRPPAAPPTPVAPPLDAATVELARILEREDRRDAADGYLLGLLTAPEPERRKRAALALGRIGDVASIEPLALLLGDPDPSVRAEAAFALGEVADPAIVPHLVPALADVDGEVRFHALEALTKAPTPEGARAERATLATEVDENVRARALLYTFRFKDATFMPFLLDRARGGGASGRAAIYALARLDVKGILDKLPGAIPDATRRRYLDAMAAAASDADSFTASVAARSLGRFADMPLPARDDALRRALGDTRMPVRIEAARGAGELLRGTGSPWPELAALADDGNPGVRAAALEALGSAGGMDAERILRGRLARGPARERAIAISGLLSMRAVLPEADLDRLARDPEAQVRIALAEGLSEEKLKVGVRALEVLIADSDRRVPPFALSAVASRKLTAAASELRSALAAHDVVLRATAADEIGKREDAKDFADALRQSFASHPDEKENDARLSLLDAFAKAGMKAEIEAALSDRDWLVRRKAADLLRKDDGVARAVTPLDPGRPASFYDDTARAAREGRPARVRVETGSAETGKGAFVIELFWNDAPFTCASFVSLVRARFYDGLSFHRIVPDFVVQDGCPRGDGNGGPGYQIRCEINHRRYARGMVGMALSGKDTGGSQYFVTLAPTPHLDGGYTIFGDVVSRMEVLERLAQGDVTVRMTAE